MFWAISIICFLICLIGNICSLPFVDNDNFFVRHWFFIVLSVWGILFITRRYGIKDQKLLDLFYPRKGSGKWQGMILGLFMLYAVISMIRVGILTDKYGKTFSNESGKYLCYRPSLNGNWSYVEVDAKRYYKIEAWSSLAFSSFSLFFSFMLFVESLNEKFFLKRKR